MSEGVKKGGSMEVVIAGKNTHVSPLGTRDTKLCPSTDHAKQTSFANNDSDVLTHTFFFEKTSI